MQTKKQWAEEEAQAEEEASQKVQRLVASITTLCSGADDASATWDEARGQATGGVGPDEVLVDEVMIKLAVTRSEVDKATRKEVENLERFKVLTRVQKQELPEGVPCSDLPW